MKSRPTVKNFIAALCEAIALARSDRAQADRIYTRYLNVKDPALLEFMYRTYVRGAIPEHPYPKLENVALGIEEFAPKPALAGKRAEDLMDSTLVKEVEREGIFTRAPHQIPEHGKYGEYGIENTEFARSSVISACIERESRRNRAGRPSQAFGGDDSGRVAHLILEARASRC